MSRIAVIGAGLSGLACAQALQARGHEVLVLDKSHGPGGRCATRRSPVGPFDHGVSTLSAFGAQHPDWQAALRGWAERAWVVADAEPNGNRSSGIWHAVPSSNALAQNLAQGLSLQADTEIVSIEPAQPPSVGHSGSARWCLRASRGGLIEGGFDAVAVALPAEQAAVLLHASAALSATLRTLRSDPCWTVMAAWAEALPIDASRCVIDQAPLARAEEDSRRPQRPAVAGVAQRWVLHAQADWSREHLDLPAAEALDRLLDAFARAAGGPLPAPVHAVAHRWRYAQVAQPSERPCGWDTELALGACGDAWHGSPGLAAADGAQRAWLSGRALAATMVESMQTLCA